MTQRRYGLPVSAVAVALFCVRLLGEPWSTHFPPQFPDAVNPGRTDTYYAVARLTPFRPRFYWAPRPIVYPTFLWLLGRSSHLVVIGQTLAYCAALGLLCFMTRTLLKTRLIANAAVVLIVLVAVEARFAVWNTQILSESLGITLGIVAIAAWWRVAVAPSPRAVTWAWASTLVWLLERDAHTVPVAVVLVPVTATVAIVGRRLTRDVRRRLLAGAGVALVACAYVFVSQKVSERNQYPFDNNIGMRVLEQPPLTTWFVEGGMPLDAALAGRRGKSAFDDNRFFVDDPSLARYRRWADGPGSRRMLVSLAVRAPDWYRMLDKQWKAILAEDYAAYDGYGVRHRLPTRLPLQVGGPATPRGLAIWLLLAGVMLSLAFLFSKRIGAVLFAATGLLVALVDVYCSFAGDAFEVGRHLAGPLSRLMVMLVVSIAVGLDAIWRARRYSTDQTEVAVGRANA
jgi:hypothetical protein